jgi:hypothetical protein
LIPFRSGREDGVSSRLATSEAWGSILIRTIWIAAFCLACLGGIFATRVTASISDQALRDSTTVGASRVQDTLTKADRLDIGYLRYPVQSVAVVPNVPIAAEIQPIEPFQTKPFQTKPFQTRPFPSSNAFQPAAAQAVSPDAPARRVAVVLPKPRPRIKPAKNTRDASIAKATLDLKTCHQRDGLSGLMMSLSGSPRCEL